MKPGTDLSQYDRIALLDAYVAFQKNWKRDHNDQEPFDQRVNDKDMKEIRDRVAKEFAKEFTKVLPWGVPSARHQYPGEREIIKPP